MQGSMVRAGMAAVLLIAAVPAGAVSFGDGTMSLAGFSSTPLFSDGQAITVTQEAAVGNPPGALALRFTASASNRRVLSGFMYADFVYDPGQAGELLSLDFRVDRAVDHRRADGSPLPTIAAAGRLLLEQSGQFFLFRAQVPTPGVVPGTFTTIAAGGLLASDFGRVDFDNGVVTAAGVLPGPDFAGAPIRFGFAVFAENFPGGTFVQSYVDNFSVTLTAVPEAGSASTLALGLAMLALGRLRRRHGCAPPRSET